MPSTTLSANDRHIIKTVIPSSTKILAASLARVYLAYPDPHSWSYSDLQGALLLVADRGRGAHFICLVDLVGSRGKIWEHEIYRGFEYNQGRVFCSFAGYKCMIGLLFPTENDARNFYKQVVGRKELRAKTAPKKQSTIITHSMSYNAENGFTSCGDDSSWVAFLNDLKAHGVDEAVIADNMDFIKSFVRGTQDREATGAANRVPKNVKPPQPPPKVDSGAPTKQSTIRMSYDAEKGFTSSGVDPSLVAFLDDLKSHGVDEAVIAENLNSIKSFVRGVQDCEAMGAADRVSKKAKPPRLPPKANSGAIIAHNMSYDAEKGFKSCGVDPSWTALLDDLKARGVDEAVIADNMDFIKGFVRGFQECEAMGADNRRSKKEKLPQPPPTHPQQDSTLSTATLPPIPHPLLPSRGTPPPRAPPSPANAPSLVTPQFPLRAPPPPSRSSVASPPPVSPPAPLSRPISIAASAPPPPRRPSVIPAPPPLPRGGGRVTGMSTSMPPAHGDLLTSTQGKGVHSLRKTDGPLPAPSPAALASSSDSSGSGVAGGRS